MFRNLIDKIRLPFRKDRKSYLAFYKILRFYPHNISYYHQAVSHKSLPLHTNTGKHINNERLEFLGDAILDAVVGDIVFTHFKTKHEGFLTNIRSYIVQRDTLNRLATEIGLDKLIQISARSTSHNNHIYGNAFEALVGAIYLDQGYERCKDFMANNILKNYIDLDKVSHTEVNFKSRLLEWGQKHKLHLVFELVGQKQDQDLNPVFYTEARIEGKTVGKGEGYSKRESQQNAARMALRKLKKDKALKKELFELKSQHEAQ